jgi:glycosyltransferase involved in cell wall biosynthesis
MNIFNFTDVEDNDKEYKYKILVYPNITFQKDLEKDSYVIVLCNIIKELNKIRDDLFFTIVSPAHINSLEFENTDQIIASQMGYPNSMRMDFPFKEVFANLKWKENDYDIVYSHLPEHTGNLKNLLFNSTNISPAIIGYTHWTEFKEITNYEYQVGLAYNIVGLLQMSKCGINTQAQKDLVLKNAKEYFNDDVVAKLDKILEPHYLGWETPKYEKQTTDKKIIVYNHRPHTYKNYPWFLEQMDKLWEKRQDFEVWVPLAEGREREYITNEKFDRVGYFSKLSSCLVGVCCRQKYEGWAISATDGMSVGVPYLFSDDWSYHELADDAGIYYEDGKQFLEKLNTILDDEDVREEYSIKSLERFEESKWDSAINQFNNMINETTDGLSMLKEDTESYKKVVDFIHKKKSVTRKQILEHLGWGVRISFSGYRNRLRNEPTIKFTKNRYEVR